MNETLSRLQDLVQLVDDGLTKKEFEAAFAAAVEHIRLIERRIMSDMETLRRKYRDLSEFTSIVDNLNTLKAEQRHTLHTMETKVASLKDGAPGAKGEKGARGERGERGPVGPAGLSVKGEKGDPGRDGIDADPKVIIQEVLAQIPVPELPDYQPEIESLRKMVESNRPRIGWGAHPLTIAKAGTVKAETARYLNFTGTGVSSVVTNPDGRIDVTISGGASATVYTETPSGTINGSNKVFTTLNSISSVFSFALNGGFIHPSEYSIVGSTITFVTAPDASLSGTSFTITYS